MAGPRTAEPPNDTNKTNQIFRSGLSPIPIKFVSFVSFGRSGVRGPAGSQPTTAIPEIPEEFFSSPTNTLDCADCGMPIVDLYGHESLRQRLRTSVTRGTLPASLLIHGPRGVGKQRLALWLGQLLLCESPGPSGPCGACRSCRYSKELGHPDLHWCFPRPRPKDGDPSLEEVKDDFIDAIRDRLDDKGIYPPPSGLEGIFIRTVHLVVQQAGMTPTLGSRKVFIIGDADRMVAQEGSDQAANAFLKLLEEPLPDTTVILTTSEPAALLPTIRSRVIGLRANPLPESDVRAFLEDPLVSAALQSY